MKSFAKALCDDKALRQKYRADPIAALRGYGVLKFSVDDVDELIGLQGQNLEDMQALIVVLEWVAEHM